ncbi:MAG: hypothetical protein HY042_05945 [Spirochaetia bacterium]|nr:hypothetical protein [Spirochaetia bacterium]
MREKRPYEKSDTMVLLPKSSATHRHRSRSKSPAVTLGLALAAVLSVACSKDPSSKKNAQTAKPEDYKMFAGTYAVEPSEKTERLELQADGTAHWNGERESFGKFVLEDKSMRVFLASDAPKITGVFLYTAYDPKGWKGKWQGQIRILRRLDSTPMDRIPMKGDKPTDTQALDKEPAKQEGHP